MDIVFNELSFSPLTENKQVAIENFLYLLETYAEAKRKYNFKHIRFPNNLQNFQITSDLTFYNWVYSINRGDMNKILSQIKFPYAEDIDEQEIEIYLQSDYSINDTEVPIMNNPIGLPIAFIKSVPAISLNTNPFWNKRKIEVLKTNTNRNEDVRLITYNLCQNDDINSIELKEWADNCLSLIIDSSELLVKYLSYSKYSIDFKGDFFEQFLLWKNSNIDIYKRLLRLMKDVEVHPFTGGIGQTENLKYKGKEASKRITQTDRLSYTLDNNKVIYWACQGHYDFHD